jgi:hypothetical protein
LNFSSVSHDLVVFDDDDPQGTVLFDDQVSSYEPEVLDGNLTSQVLLPRVDEYKLGTVIKRSVDANAQPKGRADSNTILDWREYLVEFDDGEVLEYVANIIAENFYSQVDTEGRRHLLMD